MAVSVAFVEGRVEDGVFQAHSLVVSAFWGERSLLYTARVCCIELAVYPAYTDFTCCAL